jgi:hypothetical protein
LAARAHQADRVRRISFRYAFDQTDPIRKSFGAAFMHGLADLGWTEGRNLRGIEWFDFASGL